MGTQNSINAAPVQYNTLIGGASGSLSNVSPGTSGQVLTSNGVSSNPSYITYPTLILSVIIQTFTSSGTYTPTTGMRWCEVEVWGGGGGGGTAATTTSGPGASCGGGGGGGGYARGVYYNTTIGTSQTVTIGAGGGSVTNGGSSSLGSLISATGGIAGTAGTNSTVVNFVSSALGGIGSNGVLQLRGESGAIGMSVAAGLFETNGACISGTGGKAGFGGNGTARPSISTSASLSGLASVDYAGGGGGAISINSSSNSGASGRAGIITIIEWVFT